MKSATCAIVAYSVASVISCVSNGYAIEIASSEYEGRPQFVIKSNKCTWYYDLAGGGFSRLMDATGKDWIAFHKTPLSSFPESAAAGYRGLPNCVFVGGDKGAGHPGFDRCETILLSENVLRTQSKSGDWQWTWTFTEDYAEFEMVKAGNDPWWFLYEGTVAGSFAPSQKFWGTDQHKKRDDTPANDSQYFAKWQTLYVGDRQSDRVLAIRQLVPDDKPDTLWFLGSSDRGSIHSPDGMIVVGFGRGEKTTPKLTGAGAKFRVALVDVSAESEHETIMKAIDKQIPLRRPQ